MTQFSELSELTHAQFKGVDYNEADKKNVWVILIACNSLFSFDVWHKSELPW
jgi:hypothetical protein